MSEDSVFYGSSDGETPMQLLKEQLKTTARRHSNKLVKKLSQVIDLPDLVADSIHQEILYSTMDGYRDTMKYNRNGDCNNEITGNK